MNLINNQESMGKVNTAVSPSLAGHLINIITNGLHWPPKAFFLPTTEYNVRPN